MAHSLEAELGSAPVEEGNATPRMHATPVSPLATKCLYSEKSRETRGGCLAQQESCGGTGTFVVGMLVRCEVCGKKFINSLYLKKHIIKRHGSESCYQERSSDPCKRRQLTTAASLLKDKEGPSPSAVVPYLKPDSSAPASDCSGAAAQGKAIEMHSTRNRQPACAADVSQFTASQPILAQNEVLISKLQSNNEKVKAEVHKEVNDALQTNEEKKPQETVTYRTVAGESRHQIEEVTSDPEVPLCFGTPHENNNGQKARPGSAPDSKVAAVKSSSCAEKESLRDTKESLRQAIRTLLTFSHREFFLRAQMTNVIKHNSKPLPEEIERHLGLPPLSISSQLAKSFLKEGFQHCHRSGLTTGNAPQNFESVAGAPPLFSLDSSCPYYLQKHKDFSQRRFSLKLIRLRDRLRMRPPSPGRMPPSSAAATYMGVSAVTQRPLQLPSVRRQLGYRQLMPPVQPLSYPCPSPLLPSYPAVDSAPGPSALTIERQLSRPFKGAHRPPAQNCPVYVKPYAQERTSPHAGIQGASAAQRSETLGLQSCQQTGHVSAGRSMVSHTVPHRGVSTVYSCSGSASMKDRQFFQDRAKSVVEANCVRPAYPADPLMNEPSLHGKSNLDCSRSSLSPCNRSGAEAAPSGTWPCPSSWLSAQFHGIGSLRAQEAGSPPQVITAPRLSSAARVRLCEGKDLSANNTSAQPLSRDSDGNTAEPESSTVYAKLRRGSQESFGESSPLEGSRPLLHHQNIWQYAVQEGCCSSTWEHSSAPRD